MDYGTLSAPQRKISARMKHLLFALSALALLSTVIPAKAGCPAGTRYDCTTTYNGKQSCGCR
jgi:hypothetical protein